MVQSARIQQIIKGDDVTLKHQIMKDVAYDAEKSRTPVLAQSGDIVKFFYANQDASTIDLIGYVGVPVGSYPASEFTVDVAGDIPASNPVPERGTKMFQSGMARTVRAEVTRVSTKKETYYLIAEVDIFERGFPLSLDDTTGGVNPPSGSLNLP